MEKWASISGWEGLYEVSTLGRVRSVQRTEYGVTKILKCRGGKYHSVILCRDGFRKSELVHRLVAQAFIPNPDDLPLWIIRTKISIIIARIIWSGALEVITGIMELAPKGREQRC